LISEKVPDDADQIPPVLVPDIEPFRVTVPPKQMEVLFPAFTTGAAVIVNITLSETAEQEPIGSFVVKVSATEPALISAALGV
jgi:hypothetical protein